MTAPCFFHHPSLVERLHHSRSCLSSKDCYAFCVAAPLCEHRGLLPWNNSLKVEMLTQGVEAFDKFRQTALRTFVQTHMPTRSIRHTCIPISLLIPFLVFLIFTILWVNVSLCTFSFHFSLVRLNNCIHLLAICV